MKILALNGSHNNEGNTAYLLNKILGYFRPEDTELINVYEAVTDAKYPFCVNCSTPCSKQCYKGTKLEELYNKVTEADFVIIGSPVYFGSMSAQLKCFFDKTRDARAKKAFMGKPACAVSVGATKYGGQQSTLRAIQDCCMVLGFSIVTDADESGCGHFGLSAQRPANEDQYALTRIPVLARRMCQEVLK